MGYFDNVNEDLLRWIPPDAKRICEVGCGTGELMKRYREINPDCEIFGIESNYGSAIKARDSGVFTEVLDRDVESIWGYTRLGFETPNLDCLVFGDVLEHLKDPWKFLTHATKEWVKPGGQVIACIPNSQNFTLASVLLTGDLYYSDAGLLDRTHTKFFTRKSIMDLFQQSDLVVTDLEPRNWSDEYNDNHLKFMKLTESFREFFGIPPKDFRNDTRAFQWLVRGVKQPTSVNKMLIRGIAANGCCARPRLTEPGRFLATIPGVRYSETETEVREGESPVVIVQRDKFNLEQVRKWIHAGVLVIGEWDDYPLHFDSVKMSNGLPIKAVHAVSTTTLQMKQSLSAWNPHTQVFPNLMEKLPRLQDRSNTPVRIFCGWQNRSEDWQNIIEPLNEVLGPGNSSPTEVFVVNDRKFYDALTTTNKIYWPFQIYEKYIEILGQCDIALLPLDNTEFNLHKSTIKLLECASNNVYVLASEYSTIYGSPTYYMGAGLTYTTQDEFCNNLQYMIDTCKTTFQLNGLGRDYVKSHYLLKDHYRKRYDWILYLLSRKDELTKDLSERIPGLI